jgi:hypothetical protein
MANVTGSLPTNGQHPPAPSTSPGDAGIAGSVTDQWAEVYPPAGGEPDDAEPLLLPATPVSRAGAVATALYGVTAVLVVVGSIAPLFQSSQPLGSSFTNVTSELSMNAWHLTSGASAPNTQLPTQVEAAPVPLGYPLLAAALLLALVVVLRLLALRRPAGDRFANALGIAGSAYVIGLVFALGTFELAWRGLSTSAAIGPQQETIGAGYWLLVTAAVVSLLATLAAYRRPPEPLFDDSVGMAIVEQPADTDDPEVPPGQPAEWPVVAVIPNDERTNW